ncbi:tectonic-3-like [Centruroides vittatus]|uniref:tectonic-3-like n=1 Tax=Centruroides vittatus TaxID=120091 RepID=UPI0035106B3A
MFNLHCIYYSQFFLHLKLIIWWIFILKGHSFTNENTSLYYNITVPYQENSTELNYENITLNDTLYNNTLIFVNATIDIENYTALYNETPFSNESFSFNSSFEENSTGFSIESSTIDSKVEETQEKSTKFPTCRCDLTAFSCDINCCCDEDCSEIDKSSFTECASSELNEVEEKYCVSKETVYVDNIKSEKLIERNGLLCIIKDNFEERYKYFDQSSIGSIEEFKKKVPYQSYSWVLNIHNNEENFEDRFKVGKPVYIISRNENKIKQWWLPAKSFNGDCKATKVSRYMIDEKVTCRQIVHNSKQACLKNKWLNARTFYKDFYFYIHSELNNDQINVTNINFTISKNESNLDLCIYGNSCIPVTPAENYICRDFNGISQNCSLIKREILSPKPGNNDLCLNVVVKVEYNIIHDGVNGIQEVIFNCETDTLNLTKGIFTQQFVVNYIWKNNGTVFRRSGNPGYIMGQPILAGSLVKTFTSKPAILLNSDSDWLTIMGKQSNGYCSPKNEDRLPVKFGENLRTGCLYKIIYNNNNAMNCYYMQKLVMDVLNGLNSPDHVGVFGNADIHNLGDWVKIHKEGEPASDSDDQSDNLCSNIVLGVDIKIAYANIGSLNNPQPKIIGIIYQYSMPQYIHLPCFDLACNSMNTHLVELKTSVSFYDVSKSVHPMYAEIPIMKISFPHEFFYPFLSGYSGSNANVIFCNLLLIVSIYFICLFVIYL